MRVIQDLACWVFFTLMLAAVILIMLPAAVIAIVMCGSRE